MTTNKKRAKVRRRITLLLFAILLLTVFIFTNKRASTFQISVFKLPLLTFHKNGPVNLQSELEQDTDIVCPKVEFPAGSPKGDGESADVYRRGHRIRKTVKSKVKHPKEHR